MTEGGPSGPPSFFCYDAGVSERSTARYETAVATFVGVLALVIMAPNETVAPIKVFGDSGEPLRGAGTPGSPTALLNEGRQHIAVEICYCSTLGDCWTLKAGGRRRESRDEVRRCPAPSERTFRE